MQERHDLGQRFKGVGLQRQGLLKRGQRFRLLVLGEIR
jgi:hypothetical protein